MNWKNKCGHLKTIKSLIRLMALPPDVQLSEWHEAEKSIHGRALAAL